MNRVFHPFLDQFVVVFINDILIHSKKEEEQSKHLRKVLQILHKKKLYAKLEKCEFWITYVTSIRHMISNDGISIDS